MPATYTAHHLLATAERRLLDFDPDTGNDAYVTLDPANSAVGLPIANFRRFLVGISQTVGTGGITAFSIGGATAADGTGYTAAASHALGSNPDAVSDHVWLEVNASQIREVLSTATHVVVLVNAVTSTDEFKVYFERAEPLFPHAGLTADYVS